MTDENSPQRRGGLARAERLPPERKSEIGRLGALARWGDNGLPMAVDEGILHIGEAVLPCAVLDTQQRVLTQSGVMTALGRARQAKGRQYYDGDVNLPAFLTAKNLKPFIPSELYVTSSQIEFRRKGGGRAFGYPAELLPKVCRVFIDADNAGQLTKAQKHIAERARILLDGLADVGIIGLIDEATGYQEKRAKDDLQKILAAYISPSLLPWSERFPIDFFREMFRVWGWPWPANETAYKGPLGPRYAGKLIKQLVLENLPPGVLQELEKLNPPNEKWQRRNRMGQLLTNQIGHPHVDKLVANMTMLFRMSDDKDEFWQHYGRAFKKPTPQGDLFDDIH
ncbi:MAG: P63C domain-containing protein [Candidatus Sulfotelmatobacter sp.]